MRVGGGSASLSRPSGEVALGCRFEGIFRHIGEPESVAVSYDLCDWRVVADGTPRFEGLKEDGGPIRSKTCSDCISLALSAHSPVLGAGRLQLGQTGCGLKPGKIFGLEMVWDRAGTRQAARLPNV